MYDRVRTFRPIVRRKEMNSPVLEGQFRRRGTVARGAGGGNRQGEVLCCYLCSLEYDVKGGLQLTSIVGGCSHDLVLIVELFPQSCLPPLISRIIPVEL